MRSARNFHPEWGYLAPAASLIRTVRIVLVATAVGAAAGASVVFSLVDRPATETGEIPVAARTLAPPVRATSAPVSMPQATHVSAQAAIRNQSTEPSVAQTGYERRIAATEPSTSSTAPPPAGITALTEGPALTNDVPQKPTMRRCQPPVQRTQPIRRRCKTRQPRSTTLHRVTRRPADHCFCLGEFYNRNLRR